MLLSFLDPLVLIFILVEEDFELLPVFILTEEVDEEGFELLPVFILTEEKGFELRPVLIFILGEAEVTGGAGKLVALLPGFILIDDDGVTGIGGELKCIPPAFILIDDDGYDEVVGSGLDCIVTGGGEVNIDVFDGVGVVILTLLNLEGLVYGLNP